MCAAPVNRGTVRSSTGHLMSTECEAGGDGDQCCPESAGTISMYLQLDGTEHERVFAVTCGHVIRKGETCWLRHDKLNVEGLTYCPTTGKHVKIGTCVYSKDEMDFKDKKFYPLQQTTDKVDVALVEIDKNVVDHLDLYPRNKETYACNVKYGEPTKGQRVEFWKIKEQEQEGKIVETEKKIRVEAIIEEVYRNGFFKIRPSNEKHCQRLCLGDSGALVTGVSETSGHSHPPQPAQPPPAEAGGSGASAQPDSGNVLEDEGACGGAQADSSTVTRELGQLEISDVIDMEKRREGVSGPSMLVYGIIVAHQQKPDDSDAPYEFQCSIAQPMVKVMQHLEEKYNSKLRRFSIPKNIDSNEDMKIKPI